VKLYRLEYVLREPSVETEDMFLAEIPALPGCRAWGNTAAKAVENLQGVAAAFLESYTDSGDPLPEEVSAAVQEVGQEATGELLVAV
jgi:predicted RNase H-like HicB family nuclease